MQILAMLVALAGTILVTSFWRQLLTLMLVSVVLVFCFGLYSLVSVMAR
ncbi:hypothetical protein [Kribbella sp. NPDC048928]|jgi:hypothetical protein